MQYLGELGASLEVQRNDRVPLAALAALGPDRIVVSPGPCTPNEAGISVPLIEAFAGRLPILGVCLGHQSIGQSFGANIVRAKHLMHGKTDSIHHDDQGLFAGLHNPFTATRYHSLIIEPGSLDDQFTLSAWCEAPDGSREIMGIRHRQYLLEGWQFHPESFLTECGHELLKRFIQLDQRTVPTS